MFSRIVNGLCHPVLAARYIGRKSLDKLFNTLPAFEEFISLQLMHRRLPKSLNAARKVGLPCNVVYDIGARHGYWSEYMSRHIKAEFILFEANEEHASRLKDRGFRFFTGVLSDRDKEVQWFGKGATGDSYYKENTSVYDNVESVTKRATTLDKLIKHQSLPLPDVIKLDTQGSEIDIMEGAQKALDHATFVYIECSLVDYNKGAPQLTEMISYMKSRDFVPCDVCEEHRKSGALIQLDVLWVRRSAYHLINSESNDLYY
jgi:FkbM family methyltransferase